MYIYIYFMYICLFIDVYVYVFGIEKYCIIMRSPALISLDMADVPSGRYRSHA